MTTNIPVVDFSRFSAADPELTRATALDICTVSRTLGFVYLAHTGIDVATVDDMFAKSASFFASSQPDKDELSSAHAVNALLRCGYVPYGREHEDAQKPSDIKEAFDIFRHDGYYRAAFPPEPGSPASLGTEFQTLCDTFADFVEQCWAAAGEVLRAFAIGFDLDPDYFVDRHGQNNILRLLHYPPVAGTILDGQMRVGSHTDFGSVTLLFLDPTGGLEVLAADGHWLAAPYIPGAILVNIGDLLQQWTNGEFRSTVHRVAVPPPGSASRSRYSIAFFCEPNNDTVVECLPACMSAGRPAHFPPVRAGDHLRGRLNLTLIPEE